jgi:hypothetical protein
LKSEAFDVVSPRDHHLVVAAQLNHFVSRLDHVLVSLQPEIGFRHEIETLGRLLVAHLIRAFETLQRVFELATVKQILSL